MKFKPLVWSQSEVFGDTKFRGIGIGGEFYAFSRKGMSDERIQWHKDNIEAAYQEWCQEHIAPHILPDPPTHRHKKRGSEYIFLGFGKMQAENWHEVDEYGDVGPEVDMKEVAIYRAIEDGSLWARPKGEWEDGRFEPI